MRDKNQEPWYETVNRGMDKDNSFWNMRYKQYKEEARLKEIITPDRDKLDLKSK